MLAQTLKVNRKIALLLIALLVAPTAWSQGSIDENPNAFQMTGDLLVARPIGVAMTVVGAAAFVVSLPFTLLAGSVSESAETLVLGPAEATFVRCLGCVEQGYSYKDVERRQGRDNFKAEGRDADELDP
ncbi:MAG: hypothetical protein Cons2KO_02870 [Congregibacter sp.]